MKSTLDILSPIAGLFMILKGFADFSDTYLLVPSLEIGAGLIAFRIFLRFAALDSEKKKIETDKLIEEWISKKP